MWIDPFELLNWTNCQFNLICLMVFVSSKTNLLIRSHLWLYSDISKEFAIWKSNHLRINKMKKTWIFNGSLMLGFCNSTQFHGRSRGVIEYLGDTDYWSLIKSVILGSLNWISSKLTMSWIIDVNTFQNLKCSSCAGDIREIREKRMQSKFHISSMSHRSLQNWTCPESILFLKRKTADQLLH